MNESVSPPRDPASLQLLVAAGRMEGRCVRRHTSNSSWDEDTNYHATDWMPARIKSGFYDVVGGFFNLDPFVFTDDSDGLRVTIDGEVISLFSDIFIYEFREGEHGKQASGASES